MYVQARIKMEPMSTTRMENAPSWGVNPGTLNKVEFVYRCLVHLLIVSWMDTPMVNVFPS